MQNKNNSNNNKINNNNNDNNNKIIIIIIIINKHKYQIEYNKENIFRNFHNFCKMLKVSLWIMLS